MRFFTKKQQFEHKFQDLLLELFFFLGNLFHFVSISFILKICLKKMEKVNVKST
jgi:hypothetical protein